MYSSGAVQRPGTGAEDFEHKALTPAAAAPQFYFWVKSATKRLDHGGA